jgi:N-methylhydantoinase A
MADAMRLIASERGIDPSQLVLMAYGGAGPTHAAALARELDIRTTVIPPHPGALSALGVGTGDLAHDYAESVLRPLEEIDLEEFSTRFERLEEQGRAALAAEDVDDSQIELHRSYVGRYIGQLHDLEAPLEGIDLRTASLAEVASRFHERHRVAYGFAVESESVFALGLRVRAVGRIPKPRFGESTADAGNPEPVGSRPVWFEETGFVETPLYMRVPWQPRVPVAGPAVIDEYDSTTIVLPGQQWFTDETGSILIEEVAR